MSEEIEQFFESAPEPRRDVLQRLREVIKKAIPGVTESYKWSRPVYGNPKDFAYLTFTKNHSTLGFYNAEGLTGGESRLEGTGKQMRHVKVRSIEDIDEPLFINWLQTAAKP